MLFYGHPELQIKEFYSFFSLLIIISSGRLTNIRWFVCISKCQRSLCVAFSSIDLLLLLLLLLLLSSLSELFTSISRTLFSILTALINAGVWMVSTRLPTYKSSSPFNNPLVTFYKSTNHHCYNCHLHIPYIFYSLARSRYLSFFSHSFSYILLSAWTTKSTILQISFFFLLIIIRSSLLDWIRLSVSTSKSQRSLSVPFSTTGAGLCIYILLLFFYAFCDIITVVTGDIP